LYRPFLCNCSSTHFISMPSINPRNFAVIKNLVVRSKFLKTWNFQGCLKSKRFHLQIVKTFHTSTKLPLPFLYQKIKLEIIYNFTKLDFFIVDGPFSSRYVMTCSVVIICRDYTGCKSIGNSTKQKD
jgi:hypothetical protein